MPLAKGTNSYVTVAEADAYFADRLDVAAWTDVVETEKSKALVTATSILDTLEWRGSVTDISQALAFPRDVDYFDPKMGRALSFSGTTPDRIVKATYELAYHLLNNDGLLDNTSSVIEVRAGPIVLNKIKAPPTMPEIVIALIAPLRNPGGSLWWRAN